jgi:hypothetical protein
MDKDLEFKETAANIAQQTVQAETQEGQPYEEVPKKTQLKSDTKQQADYKKVKSATAGKKEEDRPPTDEKDVRLQAISDRARKGLKEDSLNFKPTVLGLVNFLKSEDTKPPLAIAVNGRWGQGKTSFMQMVESELKKKEPFRLFHLRKTRFATAWFNPWKFSETEKVWASFVDVITRCIRSNLGIVSRIVFEFVRFMANVKKRFNFAVAIRLLVLLAFAILIYWLVTDKNMADLTNAALGDFLKKISAGDETKKAIKDLPYKNFLTILGALVVVYQLYFKVVQKLNLGLLEYLQETDFSDKIGTLAEFDAEMARLNACIPESLRIAIFIDDLDRCKPGVLLEIIQALQLLHVSDRCIFILGLDLEIVSNSIEKGIPELSDSVGPADGNYQHGRGYQFLEKIIHTRINVPYYSNKEIETFISRAISQESHEPIREPPSSTPKPVQNGVISDSPEVASIIKEYGKTYFVNPRRLKKFINMFRLYVHLGRVVGRDESSEMIARFLILAEKWPGAIEILRSHPSYDKHFQKELSIKAQEHDGKKVEETIPSELLSVLKLPEVATLLKGDQPINSSKLKALCEWIGFQYYGQSIESSKEESK